MKYFLVGGNPFSCYTGTTTFTGLKVLAITEDKEEAERLWHKRLNECAGLAILFDEEGNEIKP